MHDVFNVANLIALVTLSALEIILGIDNIVIIAIITQRLPKEKRRFARRLGLALALIMRIALLSTISWLMSLETALFHVGPLAPTGKDLILFGGGVFLIIKSIREMRHMLLGAHHESGEARTIVNITMRAAIIQIMLLDIVFSLDSVITAVGIGQHLYVMIAAVVLAVGVMLVFTNPISEFVEKHPTINMLALSFVLLIGIVLVGQGLHYHIAKGYIYGAMGFSLFVELMNLRVIAMHTGAATALEQPLPGEERVEDLQG